MNFTDLLKSRRSTRTWADNQPSEKRLRKIAYQMIEGAKWAPNSGNRQAWRFKIIIDDEKKKLLDGIKEEHTVSAPLLIFVGMDTRLYGDVADSETSIYLDAGAAIMQMVLTAHNAGLGTCWNHFGKDLIKSRESNKEDYQKFTNRLDIPDYIEPMAIVCVGKPEFIPPIPERSDNERYIIS
ncbi:NADH dehydrogenase/NAD(P)H nitroreductase [Haloferax sp. ATCC BAA-646]|nr:NADH dehydrogenase/NAD(P)H nitroreductase [Haloferax sp. ATCC BAA-646]